MSVKMRLGAALILFLIVAAILLIVGLPYGKMSWTNAMAAYEPGPTVPLNPDGSQPPLGVITCNIPLYTSPGGALVVFNGSVLRVSPGARWFRIGKPTADKTGQLWQAIFVGSANEYAYVPVSCIS